MKVRPLSLYPVLLMFLFVLGSLVEAQAQPSSHLPCADGSRISSVLKLCDSGAGYGLQTAPSNCPDDAIAVDFPGQYCTDAMIPLAVYCVNLEKYLSRKPSNKNIQWPQELEPIHLQYPNQEGIETTTEAIMNWVYSHDYTHPNGDKYTVYRGDIMIPLSEVIDPANCSTDPSGQTIFNLAVDVVTPDEGSETGHSAYPFHEYGKAGDLFSCQVFTENCSLCSEAGSGCPTRPEINSLKICFDCRDCEVPDPEHPNEPDNTNNRLASTSNVHQVSISPNPFSDFVEYKYTATSEEQIRVHLVSIDGSLVLEEVKKIGIGENNFILDTSHLGQGLYFLQINSGSGSILKRLTKMD